MKTAFIVLALLVAAAVLGRAQEPGPAPSEPDDDWTRDEGEVTGWRAVFHDDNELIAVTDIPDDQQTRELARAIALAEGFFYEGRYPGHPSGLTKPQRLNNPCDLTSGGVLRTFATVQDGWDAAYRQIELMRTGRSRVYQPTMTFAEIAMKYTGNDNPYGWAQTVTRELGIAPDWTLAEYYAL